MWRWKIANKALLPDTFVYLFALLILAALAATAYHATRLRQETLRTHRELAQNLARVGEHELTLNLRMVDRLLEARAAQWIAGNRDAAATELLLRADLAGAPVLRSLSIVDAQGVIEASSIPGAAGRQLDAPVLAAVRPEGAAPDVAISRPWRGRDLVDGVPATGAIDANRQPFFFTASRRSGGPGGRYSFVAALNPDYIADFHTTLLPRPEYEFEVYRYDGIRLTSTQPERSPPGADAGAEPVFSQLLADREIGIVENESAASGAGQALVAFRASRLYPVVVQVRLPQDAVLAHWRNELRQLATATGVTVGFILLLAIPLYRHQVRSRQADARLRKSEQDLRRIIDLVPHFIFAKNIRGEFILANQAVAEAYGSTVENLAGKTDADFNRDPVQVEHFIEDDREVIRSGLRKVVPEEMMTDAAGHQRYLQTTKIPFFTPDQDEPAVLSVASDITERKEAQRLQTALYGISEAAHTAKDLPDLFARIHAIVGKLLPARNLFVALHDPERDEVSFPYFIDEHDPVPAPRRLEAGGLSEAVIRTGEALLVTPERMARMVAEGQSILGTDSLDWLGVPLKTEKRTIGVLTVQSYSGNVRYTARDQALLQFVSDQVATAIERKQAQQALHAGEERYRSVIAAMAEGIVVRDRDANVVDCNASAERMLGETLAQMKSRGQNIRRTLYREDGEVITEQESATMQALNTGQPQTNVVYGHRAPDGTMMWLSLNAQPLYDEAGQAISGVVTTFTDITEKKESEALIWQQANFDSLTQLPNRRMFRDRLEQAIKKSRRDDSTLAILFIDLDRFKEVNDAFGHNKGDLLLVEAARRIRDCVRESDTVARLGGDEFTVILSEIHDSSHVELVAEKIIGGLASPFWFGAEQAFVSASIGITLYPVDGTGVEDLLKHADQALYVAKGAGRNRFSYFTAALQFAAQARMRLTSDLRRALEDNQFSVQFQPMVHLATGDIHHAEALLRWTHPQRGEIEPTEFIPVAEASGLIIDIGDWVFGEAARWVARWRHGRHANFQVSVNQSPLEFQGERNTHAGWLAHLRALNLPGSSIVIEITEGLLLDASPTVTDELRRLRAAGMQVAIDDFGIGYSSLAYLKKFHIDYLKIDQSFVRNLAAGSNDLALCEAIIVMAHKLGLRVIAEGVETGEQRDLLHAAGCDYGQGFLFGRPLSGEALEAILHPEVAVT